MIDEQNSIQIHFTGNKLCSLSRFGFPIGRERWRLSVTADTVEVVLPEGSHLHPEKLLREYAAWILEKQEKLKKRKTRVAKNALPEGQILLLGKPMLLEIKPAGLMERQTGDLFARAHPGCNRETFPVTAAAKMAGRTG